MIKIIVFDLGGVLVELDYNQFLINISEEFNITIEEIVDNIDSETHKKYMKGILSTEEYVDITCKKYNHSISFDRFKELWTTILKGQNDPVAQIVTNLQQNYEMALLSNVDPWHFTYCKNNYPIVSTFQKKFLSYEQQMLKPDPVFFQYVVNELNYSPEQCLFIDDLEENVQAAKEVGYQTIQFKNASQLYRNLTNLNLIQ